MRTKRKRVGLLDAGWLWLESDSNLMHGSILAVFTPPPDRADTFVPELVEHARTFTSATSPFDRKLSPGFLSGVFPKWEMVDVLDLDYHLDVVTLAEPTEREFARVVSSLHGAALDKGRPLWRIHVIDGLPNGRFAVLGKMHHALVDGVGALGILNAWLTTDSTANDVPPMWAYVRPERPKRAPRRREWKRPHPLRGTWALLRALWFAVRGVSARPWSGPKSRLNAPITASRRVATQSFGLDRIRVVTESTGATINDVVLAVCAGGLRRYLDDLGGVPARPLVTNMPVSVRGSGGQQSGGNAISWAMLSLATNIDDPLARFRSICASTTQAKANLAKIPGKMIDLYTLLAVTPILVEQLAGIGGKIRPLYNVPISNVPGPRETLYFNGARLEHVHAMTVLYGGQALNIVALSYGGTLELAFSACDTALPHVQRLAGFCADAFEELQKALAIPAIEGDK